MDIERILSTLVTIHTFQFRSAIHAVRVIGTGVTTDTAQTHGFDVATDTSAALVEYFSDSHCSFFIFHSFVLYLIYMASASVASNHNNRAQASNVAIRVNKVKNSKAFKLVFTHPWR
jgi:hypothetical protein